MYKMNPKYIGEILKETDDVFIYLNPAYSGEVCKKYCLVRIDKESRRQFNYIRNKSIEIKKDQNWPDFIIKPTNIGKMNKECFTVRYPFIKGDTLYSYVKKNDISLEECAILLKKLESKLANAEDYVISDVGNPRNIIIQGSNLDFTLIDPDNVVFKNYNDAAMSSYVSPSLTDNDLVYGLRKCRRYSKYTKQLELRSMYALLYFMLNGNESFYPIFFERDSITEYRNILQSYNIPESSELYKKSIQTLYNNRPNEPISDSIFELVRQGYEFETYGKDDCGYKHILVKKQ